MFEFFKKKPKGSTATFTILGMHCTSCSINIDGELEDTPGVIEARTSFAQSKTTIVYQPEIINTDQLKKVIFTLGYQVRE